ncbi:MAG: DNA-binding protein [Stigonema ocellatum SAG 48.90 = DSM 106950]|nr:DNA-binding protein [Stigonema ocellatum SAG 48.90 = DSM 106950]
MNTITIEISDERLLLLQKTATNLGVSIEQLLLLGVEELVNKQESSFKSAMNYVVNKNAELYHRLA